MGLAASGVDAGLGCAEVTGFTTFAAAGFFFAAGFFAAAAFLGAARLAAGRAAFRFRAGALRAPALRAVDFRAADFRAGLRLALVLRAVALRAGLRRAEVFLATRRVDALAVRRAPVLRAVLRATFLTPVLRAVLRAVDRLTLPRAALARLVVLPLRELALRPVVRFFPLVFVAMVAAPVLFKCRTRPFHRTRTCTNQRYLIQPCRPTWRVNCFFHYSLYADRKRKWQLPGNSSELFR